MDCISACPTSIKTLFQLIRSLNREKIFFGFLQNISGGSGGVFENLKVTAETQTLI